MESEVTKARKRRSKLQANVILNLNKPCDLNALEAVANAVRRDRADAGEEDDMSTEKGKRKRVRRRLSDLERLHESGHQMASDALAQGEHDGMHQECPDETKALGTPPANPLRYALDYAREQSGKGAPVTVDQQPARAFQGILASLRTNSPAFVGQAGFASAFGHTDRPEGAPGDQADVRGLDARSAAGEYHGMMPVGHAPRTDQGYRTAPAGASNGTHSLRDPESHAVSNKSRLDIMRDEMRKQGI